MVTLEAKNLRQKHASLFGNENHPIADGQTAKFELKAGFFKARTAPYAMAPKAEEELDSLIKTDVIEPVAYSDWTVPIIPVLKSDSKVRIKELYAKLSGGARNK